MLYVSLKNLIYQNQILSNKYYYYFSEEHLFICKILS